ncbi:MAG: phosphoribosylamine--glycine ligase [Pseudomonadota bacterium]
MNILLIGGGGREHALAWKISQSPLLHTLYCAPGNAGIADHATCVSLDAADHDAVVAFCKTKSIALVVIGPEAPLVAGLADDLRSASIPTFGPSAKAAQLEGSKGFTKDLCRDAKIPTAAYARFTEHRAAVAYAEEQSLPLVIKADGLAAGKGVTIAETHADARAAIAACFDGAFGASGHEVVIEAFLQGEEASFFVLSDGDRALPLATAQDHKRVGDGDTGPNTGGMGAYSPAPVMTDELIARTMTEIITPTIEAMRAGGMAFQGVLYAGLMITANGPELIEYNVRFGDPECQALMARLTSDIVPVLLACANGDLSGSALDWRDDVAMTVVAAASGYPGKVENGSIIGGIEQVNSKPDVTIFHAGTVRGDDGTLRANGGRVLGVTAIGPTAHDAQRRVYAAMDALDWPGGFWRHDIGYRAVARENEVTQ